MPFFIIICYFSNTTLYATIPELNTYTSVEKWILERITVGEIADLKKQFPDEADRVINSSFIENLLTNSLEGVEIHRHGVRIMNAIFAQPIDLVNAEIPHEILLGNCHFGDNVNLLGSLFRKSVSFEGSLFKKEANFNGMKVGDNMVLINVVFESSTILSHANIGGNFEANEVIFKSKQKANFNTLNVCGCVFFKKAVFAGEVDFIGSDIGGNLYFNRAQFKNPTHKANFNSINIQGYANFEKVIFNGPVDFGYANIDVIFYADLALFTNPQKKANFKRMRVGGSASFKEAIFKGPANFSNLDIGGDFCANKAKFHNTVDTVNFRRMKVGSCVFLKKTVFSGPVDFRYIDIGGNFEADNIEFKRDNDTTQLSNIKVNGYLSFKEAIFKGPVSMTDGRFLDLSIQDSNKAYITIPCLDLSRTVIKRELLIKKVTFQDLVAISLRVEGSAKINNVDIGRKLNLEYSNFLTLDLNNLSLPDVKDSVRLVGMNYQYISAGSGKETLEKLLELINKSVYSETVYANLEAFFWRQGYPKYANDVFVAQKLRERSRILWWDPRKWMSIILHGLVRYGRSPIWGFGWSALFVGIGACVFYKKDNMIQQKEEYKDCRDYNCFFYSLDLFLPIISLHAENIWIPKKDQQGALVYMRIHKIIGWILIPIGLAAITGIIK